MKPVVIILPGWLHTSKEWAAATRALSEYDVRIIDLPGFGIEPLVSNDWSIPEYASWVNEKIESMHTPCVIVGHSFGGRIAAYLASQQKPWLKGVILYAAPCLYEPSLKVRMRSALARTAKKIGIAALLPEKWKPYDVRQADQSGLGAIFRRAVPYSLEQELHSITIPTSIIWGSNDAAVPVRIGEKMHTIVAHSTLTVLPREGHNIHLDNSNLLYGTLRTLLAHHS